MEAVTNFFLSNTGQFISAVLIVLGCSNMLMPYLVVNHKIKRHEASKAELAQEKHDDIETEINRLKIVQRTLIGFGIALLIAGAYGLTRIKTT